MKKQPTDFLKNTYREDGVMTTIVTDYLRNSAAKKPEKVAIIDGNNEITYSEWLAKSESMASKLIELGIFKKPVGILMHKSAACMVTFLGVAMSGNYYTVLDEKMPEQRVKMILDCLNPEVIVVDGKNLKKAEALASGAKILLYDEAISTVADQETIDKVERRIISTDLLYVLFTSGSTGIPKGVTITHRSVINFTEWASEAFEFNENTVFGNQAPFYFDTSVLDIYTTLKNGGSVHIIPQMCFSFPIRLLEYVRNNKINSILWVPTVLIAVSNLRLLDKCDVGCLKKILFAGEVMPAKHLNYWVKNLTDSLFVNMYGPTEITVISTYYILDRILDDNESVPIGYACKNTGLLVLNSENREVCCEEKGELCIRGTCLSFGYYGDFEKSSKVFVQNPLNNLYEEKIYRTGDIVHYNERGEIIFDGRMDSQVKHTGHRIELGEIDTAVSSIEAVEMCCCLHKPETDQLVLYYSGDIESQDIRKKLTILIPDYMIPNLYIQMKKMPLNMNGKIDRVLLRQKMEEFQE